MMAATHANHLARPSGQVRQRAGDIARPDPAQDRRLESEAARFAHDPRRPAAASARRGPAAAQPVPGFGEPLPSGLQAALQPRLGIDLAALRVHHDEAAAQAADDAGARAFAQGRDLVFGRGEFRPGDPAGQALLAHEVAHAAQQGQPGAAAGAQRDPRPAEGPGRSPPTEAFTEMPAGDTGAEEGHVLFGRDDAVLDAGDREALDALAAGAAPGTVVHVHGYASGEGDADYNLNLSAHRAVAVKEYLHGILPADTRITAYAYGETEAFGNRSQNRRVGVDVIEPGGLFNPDFGARFGLHLLPPQSVRLGGVDAGGGPITPIVPPPSLLEALAEGPPPPYVRPSPLDSAMRLPSDLSLQPPAFDYSGVAGAYAERGLAYGSGEASSAADAYQMLFRNYLWLGPDLAAQAAQFTVDSTVSANLSVQAPTRFELLDRQNQTEPTIVPVFNDTALRWLVDRFR